MDKIREALLRAREDEEFRAAHPVSALPDQQGSPDESVEQEDRQKQRSAAPKQDAVSADPPAARLAPSAGPDPASAVIPTTQQTPPTPPPVGAADVPGRTDSGPQAALDEIPGAALSQEMPTAVETVPAVLGADSEGLTGSPGSGTGPDPTPVPSGGDGPVETPVEEGLLSGSRSLRIVSYIAFGGVMLAGFHFFVEPLGPYVEVGLEYMEFATAAVGPLWDLISRNVEAGIEAVQALLRDLFG